MENLVIRVFRNLDFVEAGMSSGEFVGWAFGIDAKCECRRVTGKPARFDVRGTSTEFDESEKENE